MVLLAACQRAPYPAYTRLPRVEKECKQLSQQVLELLPRQKRTHAAQQEATWLAETAYKASASIARYNRPLFVNWLNNRTVNTRYHWRHRGLCWHYQHDLYRELRRRPLRYYRLGCCVRDRGTGSEHHVVYIQANYGKNPEVVLLDAWMWNGRLQTELTSDGRKWKNDPASTKFLAEVYPEGHRKPLEHWAMVRRGTKYNDYVSSDAPGASDSRQWRYMQEQMKRGMKQRKGNPVDY